MRRLRVFLIGGLWLVVVILAVRLAVVVCGTESGSDTLLAVWRDATVGWFTGERVPLLKMDPDQQAEFWLAEADRVLAEKPDDAELTMGAAIMLAGPSVQSMWARHTKFSSPVPGLGPFPEMDYKGMEREERRFEEKCARRCLELAEKATTLEPDNPAWWRLRAVLQFHGAASQIEVPRNPDWLEVLDLAANHDPDNALYDYLAVEALWKTGLELEFNENEPDMDVLLIRDPEAVSLAEEYLDRAQAKSKVRGCGSGLWALDKFLDRSGVSAGERPDIVGDRLSQVSVSSTWMLDYRWLLRQASFDKPDRSSAERLELYRKNLRFFRQCSEPDVTDLNYFNLIPRFRKDTVGLIEKLLKKHPELMSKDERAALQAEITQDELNYLVAAEASKKAFPTNSVSSSNAASNLVWGYSFVIMPPLIVVLAFLALLCWGAAKFLFRTDQPAIVAVGFWSKTATWILGLGLSVLLFAIFPAEIVSPQVQSWIAIGTIGLMVVLFIFAVLFYPLRRRRYQFTLGEALIGMIGFALLCGLIATASLFWGDPDELVSCLHISAKGAEQFTPEILKTRMNQVNSTWAWPLLQWIYYGGAYWVVGFSLGLLACWYWLRTNRCNRKREETERLRWLVGRRVFWHHLFRCLGRSAWAAAVVLLIVFLVIAPKVVRLAETHYQETMAWVRDADKQAAAMRVEVEVIRKDKDKMQEFEAEVDAMYGEDVE